MCLPEERPVISGGGVFLNNSNQGDAGMKEETVKALEQSLVTIIEKATTGIDTAVSFLSAEIPDVIHQLLMWKMVNSILTTAVLLIIPISFFALSKKFKREIYDE